MLNNSLCHEGPIVRPCPPMPPATAGLAFRQQPHLSKEAVPDVLVEATGIGSVHANYGFNVPAHGSLRVGGTSGGRQVLNEVVYRIVGRKAAIGDVIEGPSRGGSHIHARGNLPMQKRYALWTLKEWVVVNEQASPQSRDFTPVLENAAHPAPCAHGLRHVFSNAQVAGDSFQIGGHSFRPAISVHHSRKPRQPERETAKMPYNIVRLDSMPARCRCCRQ